MSMPYLIRLAQRLTAGLSSWPDSRRESHRSYIRQLQRDDGGFAGREGDSDLYYTSFAVRSLAILDAMDDRVTPGLAAYLRTFVPAELATIDFINWLYAAAVLAAADGPNLLAEQPADWDEKALAQLESLRRDDGGFAKGPEGTASSMYHSFLAVLCYELLGRPVPMPGRLTQFIYDRQRDDGGFVEIAPMRRSGTNPTAAAVALLTILGRMDNELATDVVSFLRSVRSEGGYCANGRIPFADGLSTFTAILTLVDLGREDQVDWNGLRQFLGQLEFKSGGFRAAAWDQQTDVEYTFYGLASCSFYG